MSDPELLEGEDRTRPDLANPTQGDELPPFQIPGMGSQPSFLRAPPVMPQPVLQPPVPPTPPAIPPAGRFAGLSQDLGLPPLPPLPQVPKPKPVPEPPKAKHSDPFMALGNPLTFVALLASTFVRNPAVAAGNALASAMEAQKQGDQERYQESYREYTQQIQKVAREQEQEHREYEAAYQNRKLSFDERQAQLKEIAARRKDSLMTAQLDANGDPSSLLMARLKAGKPVTEAEMKMVAAHELMKKDPTLSFTQAIAQVTKEMTGAKEEAKAEHRPGKPLTMTQLNAKDVEDRTKRILTETPGITEDLARSRALQEHQTAAKVPAGAAWSTLDPVIQNVVTGFPAAREKLAEGAYKLPPARQGQLIAGLKVLKDNDRVAAYIAENPDAVGVLPLIYQKYHATLFSKPTVTFENEQEAAAKVAQIADQQGVELRSLGGKMRLPDGRVLSPGLAEKAAVLNKMLIQTGLTDAAQMSASGRGGTIYLDKLMTERIYNQKTNPYTLMTFLADRSRPAVDAWKMLDPAIDLSSPDAPLQFRSQLLMPGGIEGFMAHAYPDQQKIATPKNEEEYKALPSGTRYRYEGKILVKP